MLLRTAEPLPKEYRRREILPPPQPKPDAIAVRQVPARRSPGLIAMRRIAIGDGFFQESFDAIAEQDRISSDPISYFGEETTIRHVNHSCMPNAELIVSLQPSPLGALRAIRPIEPGCEVTINYLSSGLSLRQRHQHLRDYYHYECRCERCEHEIKQDRLAEQRTWSNFLWPAPLRGPPPRQPLTYLKPESKASLF